MSNFHLRPVSENSPSPSPTASTTPSDDRGPVAHKVTTVVLPSAVTSATAMNLPRRPFSPSSLRDVDLSNDAEMHPRKYPAPPLNGHDLMALFPPAPPDSFPEMRPGPTSGFFQRQERAFFAQAGKEIVRVRVEVDMTNDSETDNGNGKSRAKEQAAPRAWPQSGPSHVQLPAHPQHHSPSQSSAPPLLYPHPNSRPSRALPVNPISQYSMTPNTQSQVPPNLHPPSLQHPTIGLRTPPHDPAQSGVTNAKVEFQAEEFRDDPDEAWRRPMPFAERRRAGKHTKRVVVRN